MGRQILLLLLLFPVIIYAGERQSDTTWCLAKDHAWSSSEHKARMKEYGITCATVYYSLLSKDNQRNPYEWIRHNYLNLGYSVVLVLKIDEGNALKTSATKGNLGKIVAGGYDRELTQLAAAIAKDGRDIVVRPLHELDGNWHPWGMYTKGNSPRLAVESIKHISQLFRKAKAPVKIEVNFNRRDARGKVLGEAEYYVPLMDSWVDMYSLSSYNRCGSAPQYRPAGYELGQVSQEFERSFASEVIPAYDRLSMLTPKPINIAEMSTTGLCALKMPWFTEAVRSIRTELTKVQMATFVFGEVPVGAASNDVVIDWGLADDEKVRFRQLIKPQWDAAKVSDDIVLVTSAFTDLSAPWTVQMQFTYPLEEGDNPIINSVTGEEFGKTGPVLRLLAKQKLLFPMRDSLRVGPGVYVGAVQSSNQNQWWNNQGVLGATVGMYDKLRHDSISWGSWSFELYAERIQFTTEAPDRYRGNGETRIGIRTGFNLGGDLIQ